MRPKPIVLFDQAGRPYRFESEEQVRPYRVDARVYGGLAAARAQAPAEVARHRPARAPEPEVTGHHLDPQAEFYHTGWEWGDLEFDGQDGMTGRFFCCHAHYSEVDARAFYDPSCEMFPVRAAHDDAEAGADEFVARL